MLRWEFQFSLFDLAKLGLPLKRGETHDHPRTLQPPPHTDRVQERWESCLSPSDLLSDPGPALPCAVASLAK